MDYLQVRVVGQNFWTFFYTCHEYRWLSCLCLHSDIVYNILVLYTFYCQSIIVNVSFFSMQSNIEADCETIYIYFYFSILVIITLTSFFLIRQKQASLVNSSCCKVTVDTLWTFYYVPLILYTQPQFYIN